MGPGPRTFAWILAILLLILAAATWFLPHHTVGDAGGDKRSRMPSVPKDIRRAFALSSTAMMAAYAFGVLVLSFGGQVEHDVIGSRSEEHTSELQSQSNLVCRLLLEKKNGIFHFSARSDIR